MAHLTHVLLFSGIGAAMVLACGSVELSAKFEDPNANVGKDPNAGEGVDNGPSTGFGDGTGDGGTPTISDTSLHLEPETIAVEITDAATPKTVSFQLKQGTGATASPVSPAWSLERYEGGDISDAGLFTTVGLVAGTHRVIAQYKGRVVSATVVATVRASGPLPGGSTVTGPNTTALGGVPVADPGGTNSTKILYPLEGTVFPKGLSAPKLQFSPGNVPPQGAKIRLSCNGFAWEGIAGITSATRPHVDLPDDIWSAALTSCGGQEVTIAVTKANGGVAYGPAVTHFTAARGSLKGVVFYMSYTGANLGLWSVRPGVRAPAIHLTTNCVVCHSVSANGQTLTAGSDQAASIPFTGAYRTNLNGTIRQVSKSPAGLTGGDGRNFSWGFLTPDGRYALRAQKDFWGGTNTLGYKVDDAGTATSVLAPITVSGLTTTSAYVPQFSPDGRKLIFINGPNASGDTTAWGTASKSLSIMDANINGATDTITFTNRTKIYDSTAQRNDNGVMVPGSSKFLKLPVFLPDNNTIVYQEGDNYRSGTGYGGMLASYTGNTGRLFMFKEGKRIELSNANTTPAPIELDKNYGPTALPVQSGGYYWVVFTSKRAYGNTLDTHPDVHSGTKRLWITAIDPAAPGGVDASKPAFYLPNQSDSENERGFFALEGCKSEGGACGGADTCCGNSVCRPDRTTGSGSTCQVPPMNTCRALDEVCTTDADCCDTDTKCLPDNNGSSYCRVPVSTPR